MLVNPVNKTGMVISAASDKDMSEIERMAKKFYLDVQEMSWEQFIVAKNDNEIIGFGRLRNYPECSEVATIGVLVEERKKGAGTAVVNELIRIGPKEIFVTCVIPSFFSKLGFHIVKKYPPVLQKKVDFCKSYDFKENQIFVMRIAK